MPARLRHLHAALLGAVALVGLCAGHVVDYALVDHSGSHHAETVAAAHRHFSTTFGAAAALGTAAAAVVFGLGVRTGLGGQRTWPDWTVRRMVAQLIVGQSLGFLAMEVGERALTGTSLADLLGPVLVIGLLAQVPIAVAAAATVCALRRTGRRVGMALASARRASRRPPLRGPVLRDAPPLARVGAPWAPRGPPPSLAA